MSTPAPTIFDTLAQHDTQLAQHDQAIKPQGDVFDQMAANNGQPPDTTKPPQGPTIGPRVERHNDLNPETAKDPYERAGRQMTGGFARLLLDAVDKLHKVEDFSELDKEQHPIQGHLGEIANKIEGFLWGTPHKEAAIGTGQYGILNNPVTGAILPGPKGTPALAEGIADAANVVKTGAQAVKGAISGGEAAEEGPGLVKQIIKGKEVAQAPARAALESGASASAQDAGVAASETAGRGVRTLLDEPIAKAAKAERATYDAINKAAGTDLKSLYDYRSDLQDALEDPTQIGQRANLQKELQTTESSIAQGEAQAIKNGVTPATVDKARGMTQQRYAMENLKQKLFNNESVVSGNVEHGAPESIKVDSAIKAVENLDKPSRYAPEGSPTRLVQALGEKGATQLKQGLYDAQKAGETALKKQKIAAWLGVSALGSGAITKAVSVLGGGH